MRWVLLVLAAAFTSIAVFLLLFGQFWTGLVFAALAVFYTRTMDRAFKHYEMDREIRALLERTK